MLARALVIWFVLLLVAIANGTVRVAWFIPRVGDDWGHVLGTVDVLNGRVWVLVLVTTALAPLVAFVTRPTPA